jgi:transposase-like protein
VHRDHLAEAEIVTRGKSAMPRKVATPEDIIAKLRQIEALKSSGVTYAEAVRSVGVSPTTYRRWRSDFGGLLRALRPASGRDDR